MALRAFYLDERDRAFVQDAVRTAGASLFQAIRLYLNVVFASILLFLPFFPYGPMFVISLVLETGNTVFFLFFPLFVLTPPGSIFWKYFLAVPIIAGLGGWIISGSVGARFEGHLYIGGSVIFLIVLSFWACIVNRRRSNLVNAIRKGDPAFRSVIGLIILVCLFLVFRLIFPIAGATVLIAAPGVVYSWFTLALMGAGVWLVWRAATKL